MSRVDVPTVSCLCVTEDRSIFMPWLLWCYDRQSWPRRELVIVDSSRQRLPIPTRGDVRVVTAPPGTGVARKRNLALREAQGEIITWFDDDDWQHPDKLAWLVAALSEGTPYAGSRCGWFVDLLRLRCARYRARRRQIVFNSAGFRAEAVLEHNFPENVRKASDTRWMQGLEARFREKAVVLDHEAMFFWLCHERNLSNPAGRRSFPKDLEALKTRVGSEAWGDTDNALSALQLRLQNKAQGTAQSREDRRENRTMVALTAKPAPRRQNEAGGQASTTPPATETPPVGVMIKATVLDAPFLDVMARHMIAQANYPFAERAIVVDRALGFSGKYRERPRATQGELDRILEQLLADGIVDHVREVDMSPAAVREIMGRYFTRDAQRVPTHAVTGGPIYPTLFGMESMATDLVLQMDADVFFHVGADSWVRQALGCMARDSRLWLMMTHPGPPGGPPGRSLGPGNARLASWDPQLEVWRFHSATTRYFLCDRRKLRGRLRFVPRRGGCAPLEQCIGDALRRHGAYRGNLGNLESWHLHVWHHGNPFPQWAAALAEAIAEGRFPEFQRGDYDLRLDRKRDRRQWSALLKPASQTHSTSTRVAREIAVTRAASAPQEENGASLPSHGAGVSFFSGAAGTQAQVDEVDRPAPLAVVIPIRNRAGKHLRNALHSLEWQLAGRPAQVLVVSLGSEPGSDRELSEICKEGAATLITAGDPSQPWNKPLALNTGIRAVPPDIPFIMAMDGDMVLAPNFLSVVLERLRREPQALVLCRSSDLPQGVPLPGGRQKLMAAFDRLYARSRFRPRTGTGGIQAARRDFFFRVRGYDEDLLWWGAMDGDMVKRAQLAGLAIEWVEDRTAMLHQWHPRKHRILNDRREAEQAKRAWRRNHELVRTRETALRRNPCGWGGSAVGDGSTELIPTERVG